MRFLGFSEYRLRRCWPQPAATIRQKPSVNEDISWHIACTSASGCGSYAAHVQMDVDQNFSVSCSRSKSAGLSITVTDPGVKADGIESPRPPSSIIVTNADPASQSCSVALEEASDFSFAPETFLGACTSSGGDCTLTGGPADGWDFKGTLLCPTLMKGGTAAKYKLENVGGGAIKLEVDNCG